MEHMNHEEDLNGDLELETVAIGLLDLTAMIPDDNQALDLMLEVVAIAMVWRDEMATLWN